MGYFPDDPVNGQQWTDADGTLWEFVQGNPDVEGIWVFVRGAQLDF